MSAASGDRHILLIGGGHANLAVLSQAAAYRRRGWAVSLVAPRHFAYSGLATSVLGGRVPDSADSLDLAALCAAQGVAHYDDTVTTLDPAGTVATTASGDMIPYSLAALNVGSTVAPLPGAAANPRVVPVKPLSGLFALGERLAARRAAGETPELAVVGGGPSGVEIAGNLAGRGCRVWLLAKAPRLVPGLPVGAAQRAQRQLERAGVAVRCNAPVRAVDGATLQVGGRVGRLPVDTVVQATGLRPAPLGAASGLPVRDGALRVTAGLVSAGRHDVFASGDCAHFDPRPLPKVGVFGVRQGPVLHRNLLARIDGLPLAPFKPQRRYLLILALGDGTGLAVRGRLWAQGRWCLRWKDRLDRPFVEGYRSLAGL